MKLIKNTTQCVQKATIPAVVFLLLLSLFSAGGGNQLLAAWNSQPAVSVTLYQEAYFESRDSVAELPESMTPTGQTQDIEFCYLVAQSTGALENGANRAKMSRDLYHQFGLLTSDKSPKSGLLNSTSQISSQLGRQFTLVGAKPSGTS